MAARPASPFALQFRSARMTDHRPIPLPALKDDRQALLDRLFSLAREARSGGQARLVGGVVRNWLLALDSGAAFDPDQDLDLAVNMPIADFAAAARKAGLSVHETGLQHGTVTLAADGQTAEVTQLRTDADTDGRHALVKPTSSWDEDAKRRDFTINAMYLDQHGYLFDPVGGRTDLADGVLRFVGQAATRLLEDNLRALRALRFLAVYPGLSMPPDNLDALAGHIRHLPSLSAERIAAELRRLMAGPAALRVLGLCAQMGVDKTLFGTSFRAAALGHEGLAEVWPELGFAVRLACLLPPAYRAPAGPRLKLSRAERRCLVEAGQPADNEVLSRLMGPHWARSAYRLGPVVAAVQALDYALNHALSHALGNNQNLSAGQLRQIVFFCPPSCPVKGRDIVNRYSLSGPAVGAVLAELEQLWVEADFTLTTDQLLALGDKMRGTP